MGAPGNVWERRETYETPERTPKEAQMLCWLAFREHMALKKRHPSLRDFDPCLGKTHNY